MNPLPRIRAILIIRTKGLIIPLLPGMFIFLTIILTIGMASMIIGIPTPITGATIIGDTSALIPIIGGIPMPTGGCQAGTWDSAITIIIGGMTTRAITITTVGAPAADRGIMPSGRFPDTLQVW